jgi:hypothetical protein
MLSDLIKQLNEFARGIKKNTAVNVNSRVLRKSAIDLGSSYFRNFREDALTILGESKELHDYDENWQYLIRLAHGNNPKNTYQNVIKKLLKTTKQINVAMHSTITESPGIKSSKITYSDAEKLLIRTLEFLVPSAAASYKQGITDLNSSSSRFSYRGTASELREALRETLNHLAPNSELIGEPWFKLEKDQEYPTMKQKVRYILKSREKKSTQRAAAEKTVDIIEGLMGSVARAVYDRASLSTHVETTREEVAQVKRYLDALLFDLLEIAQ